MGGRGFDERYRCTAVAKTTGERCRRAAHPGATVCTNHGAGAPQVRAKAKQRLQEQRVQAELGKLMHELELEVLSDGHPLEVLAEAVARANAMVGVIGVMVGQLKAEPGNWERPGTLHGLNHLGDGAPHVATTMYLEWIKEAGRLSKLAIDAGLDERRVILAESQMQLMSASFTAVLLEVLLRFERAMPKERRAELRAFIADRDGLGEVLLRKITHFEENPHLAVMAASRAFTEDVLDVVAFETDGELVSQREPDEW